MMSKKIYKYIVTCSVEEFGKMMDYPECRLCEFEGEVLDPGERIQFVLESVESDTYEKSI